MPEDTEQKPEQPAEGSFYPTEPLPEDSVLAKVGTDLTRQVSENPPGDYSEREAVLDSVMRVLGRRGKGNPLVIGEAGVGKTFLIRCLAHRIVERRVPPWIEGKKVIQTSYEDIIASVEKSGDWAWHEYVRRLKALLDAACDTRILLFVDELHRLFEYEHSNNILKPYLADGRIRLIGATTSAEYLRYLARQQSIARRFQLITLEAPAGAGLARIIGRELETLERAYSATAADGLERAVVRLADEYLPYLAQPDKSFDLMEQAFVNARAAGRNRVEVSDVRAVIAETTGIPDEELADEQAKTLGVELALNRRVLGQEHATAAIARRLLVTRSRVQVQPDRPLGVFLLAGPTGVGKTEMARALARHVSGREDALVRVDMSVYKTIFSLGTLLGRRTEGDKQGELPELTLRLRQTPYAVLLLDEFEKADEEVWDVFLQAFDYGRLTDYQGNVIYFGNVVVVMTTNVGFERKSNPIIPFGAKELSANARMESDVREAVRKTFRPEFVGRVDSIIILHPLPPAMMDRFIEQKLERLSDLVGRRVTASPEAITLIREQGFDERLGARRLNRAIDDVVGTALAGLKPTPAWETARKVRVRLDADGTPVAEVAD